jgi:hypothetical protein
MYLWPIDGCLELIDFCLTKSKLFEQPFMNNAASSDMDQLNFHYVPDNAASSMNKSSQSSSSNSNKNEKTAKNKAASSNKANSTATTTLQSNFYQNQYLDFHKKLITMLTNKKTEFIAYKELTKCARLTLEKYYEHQQIQDAAGFYDTNNANLSFSSTNVIDLTFNMNGMNKMKKVSAIFNSLFWAHPGMNSRPGFQTRNRV